MHDTLHGITAASISVPNLRSSALPPPPHHHHLEGDTCAWHAYAWHTAFLPVRHLHLQCEQCCMFLTQVHLLCPAVPDPVPTGWQLLQLCRAGQCWVDHHHHCQLLHHIPTGLEALQGGIQQRFRQVKWSRKPTGAD